MFSPNLFMKYILIFCIFIQLFLLNTWAQTSVREIPLPPSETTVNPATTSSPSPVSPSKEPQTSVNNTFARLRIDYSTISTRVRPQFVVGWTPSPGTALYAGYNDDFNRNGFNPFTGDLEPGFRSNGRTFFIKASYLFRKSF